MLIIIIIKKSRLDKYTNLAHAPIFKHQGVCLIYSLYNFPVQLLFRFLFYQIIILTVQKRDNFALKLIYRHEIFILTNQK
jgi:hypothetical protein